MSFASATLKAQIRDKSGTGAARAVRRSGGVPVIVYGKGKKEVLLSLDARELTLEYQRGRFFSRIVEIDAGGQKLNVLPQEMQMDPVKDTPVHADFLAVDAKSRVKVAVPVVFANQDKSPGIKKGGILNAVRRAIDVFCDADSIPEKFVADLNGLQIGGNIKWHNIEVPKGVESVIVGRDFTIATIAGRMAEEAIPTTAPGAVAGAEVPGATAAPGATPAPGAAAPAAGAAAAKAPAAKK